MKHLIIFSISCILSLNGRTQPSAPSQRVSIIAHLIDSETGQPIPYATIYNLNKRTGSISNLEGYFKLEELNPSDSISIFFIGYTKYYRTAMEFSQMDTIYLTESAALLNEVMVLSNDAFLYELLAKSKKTNSYETRTAKTYFELETYANGEQTELVECYYNGIYKGYDVDELIYKNGRLALRGFGGKVLYSTATSRAILMHKLTQKNDYFPKMPFEYNQSKMRKFYSLTLSKSYKDEQSRTIYAINFKPRKEAYFAGIVWIDSVSHKIQKVKLNVQDAKNYPFQLMGYKEGEGLKHVNIQITKSFIEIDGSMFVDKIDFNYELEYTSHSHGDSAQKISSNSILYAYDYKQTFIPPIFNFQDSPSIDYIQIFTIPKDSIFWKHFADFSLNDVNQSNEIFYQAYGYDLKKSWFTTHQTNTGWQTDQSPYMAWSRKRVLLREWAEDEKEYNPRKEVPPSRLYNLECQILLDINEFDGAVYATTKTFLDPYKSFYHLPIDNLSICFVNIYFDLVEIQRRELEMEIEEFGRDENTIRALYDKRMEMIEDISQNYFSEVNRGKNVRSFAKWDAYVNEQLGISNRTIFNVSAD